MDEKSIKWSQLNPRDCIQVTQQVWLTQRELQFVTQLYVPFLGVQASTLYLVLFSELSPNSYQSDVIRLADLLALVNMGIPDFYQARIRLESVGLLKTYRYEDEESISAQYTFELQAPASPNLFFKDALLSTLLVNQVGHQRFENLQKRFSVKEKAPYGQDVTSTFQEGFQLPFNMSQYKRNVAQEKQMIKDVKQQESLVLNSNIDWELLTDLLKSQFVHEQALTDEVKQMLNSFQLYYGLTEREISQYVIYAADLSTGEIDEKELYSIIINANQHLAAPKKEEASITPVESTPEVSEVVTEEKQEITPAPTQLPQAIQRLITLAKEMTPFDFMTSIKQQRNGYVSNGEQRIILDLVQVGTIPSEVINILIHYVLVVKNNPTINKNLIDTIANDWSQKGIQTAEQAIEAVRQRDKEFKASRKEKIENRQVQTYSGKKYYGNAPKGRVASVPDWAMKPNETKESPLDDENLQLLKAQLSQLKTSGNSEQVKGE
ncbi:replication initiation and membrane attachment family protein [Granulicatella sp.]